MTTLAQAHRGAEKSNRKAAAYMKQGRATYEGPKPNPMRTAYLARKRRQADRRAERARCG